MEILVEHTPDGVIIAPEGSLNTTTAPEFESVVESTLAEDDLGTTVVFDFSKLEYISSAGLRVLMIAYKSVIGRGGVIELTGASEEVQEVLEVTGLAELFEA